MPGRGFSERILTTVRPSKLHDPGTSPGSRHFGPTAIPSQTAARTRKNTRRGDRVQSAQASNLWTRCSTSATTSFDTTRIRFQRQSRAGPRPSRQIFTLTVRVSRMTLLGADRRRMRLLRASSVTGEEERSTGEIAHRRKLTDAGQEQV